MSDMLVNLPGEPAGRRERKKLQTRHALQDAALRLVTERGFDAVTVEDIAEAVDVSKRTFFNYFNSKEQAVLGHEPTAPEDLCQAILERPADESPLQSLAAVLGQRASELGGSPSDRLARRRVIRSDSRLLAASAADWLELERALVEAMAERLGMDPERELYPALVVSASISAVRVATLRSRAGDGDLPELVAEAFAALAGGLDVPPHGAGSR